jgi:hypothetical protein
MRFYHSPLNVEKFAEEQSFGDDDRKAILRDEAKKHFKLGRPHHENLEVVDGKVMLRKPRMFWQMVQAHRLNSAGQVEYFEAPVKESKYVEWTPGSVMLSLPEVGMPRGGDRFWVIPPGGSVDVPDDIPVKTVKDACPHLVTEAEYQALGLTNDAAPSPKPKLK